MKHKRKISLSRLSIGNRLTLLVAGLLALLACSSVNTVLRLSQVNASIETIYNDHVVCLRRIKAVSDGFAVVAGEMRALAQRSSAAAKEIKELIDTSVVRVADGTKHVNQAGRTMGEVIEAVSRVSEIMRDIATASDEQSRGIDQVGQAVTQMDDVTQQNAALVQEAAAAAQSLEGQAAQLNAAVALFRLRSWAS